jgi:uracil-DNA glycosylase
MYNTHKSWNNLFNEYNFYLESIYTDKTYVYPKKDDVFRIFKMDVNKIKVVILAQDPYHTQDVADGLAFSSKISIQPSLRNIFKELQIEFPKRNYNFKHGDLSKWVENENIFLLNCSLTVVKSSPGSHMNIWKEFTDDVIRYIDKNNDKCVFLLLGNFAKDKANLITNKNNIITAVHPSPFSAHNGFFNSGIFLKIEDKIRSQINCQN